MLDVANALCGQRADAFVGQQPQFAANEFFALGSRGR